MPLSLTFDLTSPADTEDLGKRLAAQLFPGAVVALIGQLGAGKTFLVRAVAEGLGVADPRQVNSPTFVLIQEYDARLPIYHFDTYRLIDEGDFADLGAHEYFQGGGVCFVEWADKVPGSLPAERLEIRLTATGEQSRRVELTAFGERYRDLLEALRDSSSSGPAGASRGPTADGG